jgi:hypothetical protein
MSTWIWETIQEEFEDTKGVIRIRKSKKNRQHNSQKTEEQTTQWLIENRQKKQQRSTKHTYKTKHYTTLHLGSTNLSKGTALLLLIYIPQ